MRIAEKENIEIEKMINNTDTDQEIENKLETHFSSANSQYFSPKKSTKGRVLVAMSGGVDSSVAAALLVEQGYEVVGVTMQVWDYSASSCEIQEGHGTCCSSIDVDDARSVADALGIPFYVINCEAKFQKTVIDDFVGSYLAGKTPVPCVNCNTFLKFDHLIQKMKELDCQFLATGHYAQMIQGADGSFKIVTSADDWKDQTYFLFTLNPEILPHLLFPVGTWKKEDLRSYAEERGFGVARKKDSTGICFVGKSGYAKFIESQVSPERLQPGELRLFPSGELLGSHEGIHHFTYGQRKGLGVAFSHPLYVVKIDPATQTVWLGEESCLFSSTMKVKAVSWLDRVEEGEPLRVKIRFQHFGASARIEACGDDYLIHFDEPQRAVTPGQAAVFYRDQQLLGGGWIE